MSEQTYQMLAIVLYFAAMLGIGYYAYRKTANLSGYMLAERGERLPEALALIQRAVSNSPPSKLTSRPYSCAMRWASTSS